MYTITLYIYTLLIWNGELIGGEDGEGNGLLMRYDSEQQKGVEETMVASQRL